eukprot:TRINITY_DN29731_c0_g1_i1.p1 TRINITY_DN29731_c0_g1~~TRINITY_DN29731_c0_g1_i1.p1  ORF type:complete len:387 (+),score=73.90 TRINITY_DN29731_c0_g1_i1:75-1235(+)
MACMYSPTQGILLASNVAPGGYAGHPRSGHIAVAPPLSAPAQSRGTPAMMPMYSPVAAGRPPLPSTPAPGVPMFAMPAAKAVPGLQGSSAAAGGRPGVAAPYTAGQQVLPQAVAQQSYLARAGSTASLAMPQGAPAAQSLQQHPGVGQAQMAVAPAEPVMRGNTALAMSYITKRRAKPEERDKSWFDLFGAIDSWRLFENLRSDPVTGEFQVFVPFCHEFAEAPLMLPFLAERFLGSRRASTLSVKGCDIKNEKIWWEAWEDWANNTKGAGPNIDLKLWHQDLSVPGLSSQLPKAQLVVAVHPVVSEGGPWVEIFRNVMDTVLPGGLLMFVCFYRHEAEATAKLCEQLGTKRPEIRENPYYQGKAPGAVGTFQRWVVLLPFEALSR